MFACKMLQVIWGNLHPGYLRLFAFICGNLQSVMGPECSNNHKGSEVCIIANSLRTGPPGLRAARRKEVLHGTIGFLGSSIRIETGASDWLTLVDKITKNSKCQQQHFELYITFKL
jgi:hypothetical protein